MDLIGHLVALNELPAARMTCYDDCLQARKGFLASKLTKDFVDNIERRNPIVLYGVPTHSPTFGRLVTVPIQFVGREHIAAVASMIRCKARCNDDRILERLSEKSGTESMPEIVVSIAPLPMNYDKRTGDPIIF